MLPTCHMIITQVSRKVHTGALCIAAINGLRYLSPYLPLLISWEIDSLRSRWLELFNQSEVP